MQVRLAGLGDLLDEGGGGEGAQVAPSVLVLHLGGNTGGLAEFGVCEAHPSGDAQWAYAGLDKEMPVLVQRTRDQGL